MSPLLEERSTDPPLNIDELAARCLGRMDLVEKVLDRFQQSLYQELGELEDAVQSADADSIARLAHRIKGTSSTVAAHGLRDCAQRLENLPSGDGLEKCLGELRHECNRLRDMIAGSTSRQP